MSNFDDKLAQHISGISKEKQPERDLWRGIELGITSQQGDASQDDASSSTVTSKQWMAIAASVCLVTVLWFAAPFAFKADENRSDGYALIDAMSMQQQQQVNSLLASYESTTALTEDWQEQLKELGCVVTSGSSKSVWRIATIRFEAPPLKHWERLEHEMNSHY